MIVINIIYSPYSYVIDFFIAETVHWDEIGDANESEDENPIVEDVLDDTVSVESERTIVRRGTINFITPRLVAALDNAKLSTGMSIHIMIAVAEALGHDVSTLIINRTSVNEKRAAYRKEHFQEIQEKFFENVI